MKENQPKYIVQDIVCASRSTPIKGLGRINRRRAVTAERVLDGQERRAAMSAKSAFERWDESTGRQKGGGRQPKSSDRWDPNTGGRTEWREVSGEKSRNRREKLE
jgi:hypothetical protein